jgi:YVTN family beta-propeller protein
MRRRIVLPATALIAAGLAALPMGGARAATVSPAATLGTAATATATALPLTSYYQMAVDSVHDHLFFSQGSSSENSILVTDFSGNTVATITGQTGVMGITLSPDGSTLYAALGGADEVTVISTATLQQVAVYPLGAGDTPLSVAVQSGKLWVSYDTGEAGSSTIGDFDLSASNPVLEPQSAMGGWYSAPMLAADPSDAGNVLVALEPGQLPAAVASYDTSQDPVTVRAKSRELENGGQDNCDNAADLAVVSGGAQFIAACASPYAHYRYSTADLSEQGVYPSTYYPDAIAIASGTGTVAAGVNNVNATDDIYVYAADGGTPLNLFDAPDGEIAARGLGLTPNGSDLFAVTENGNSYSLNIYPGPGFQQASLTLAGATTVSIGHAVTLNGTLTVGGGASPLAGAVVAVTRTGPGGTQSLTATTNSGGAFTLTDTPPSLGSYTYTASFAGNGTSTPAAATLHVTVSVLPASLTLTGTATATLGHSVTLQGSLKAGGASLAGAKVAVTRTGPGGSKTTTFTTNADGGFTLTATGLAVGSYVYTASYAGNATTSSATAKHNVTMSRLPTSLTVSATPGTANYDGVVRVTAHLGATATNRTVEILGKPRGVSTSTRLADARVNSSGNLTVSVRVTRSTTFTAVFAGDARYAAKSVATTMYTRADVAMAIADYYASKRVGSVTYRLYHRTKHLNVGVAVAPNKKGECAKVEIQEYYRGAWHPNVTTNCVALNKNSVVGVYFTLNQADIGYHYRLRGDYVRGSDLSNLSVDTGWQYFMVEK